jgi:hypothetical protein
VCSKSRFTASLAAVTGAKWAHKALYFLVTTAGILISGVFIPACEPVNGAAVEVSWVVHTPGGYAIDDCSCAEPAISNIRLLLTPQSGTESPRTYTFPCKRQRGATPFEVPEGNYELGIQALDASGQVAGAVVTPPPFLRKLVWGQPASMDAQLIKAPCASRCANKNGTCNAQ